MGKLDGKIALVTGGSKGIGFATAKLFAEEGAQVIITGRDQDGLDTAKERLPAGVECVKSDAGNLDDIEALFATIKSKYGRLDTVFLNAGIAEGPTLDQTTPETFDRHMGINMRGPFFTAQQAARIMQARSSITFVSSIAATMGIEYLAVYSASKAALLSFTKTLASELARTKGIRVNAISPGYIATPLSLGNNAAVLKELNATIPLENRFGDPEEIAKTALFLAADATYMTGQELVVDGGLTTCDPSPARLIK